MTERMSGNTLGTLFCVTSFGESHGPAIGCVVDGCPPGMALSVESAVGRGRSRATWMSTAGSAATGSGDAAPKVES